MKIHLKTKNTLKRASISKKPWNMKTETLAGQLLGEKINFWGFGFGFCLICNAPAL